MGRRKIEIQPITHERNRSVTFLKRKNGLFKKAYELGVLCSVDVAIIIFNPAGSSNKLFEFTSTDLDSLIRRRSEFQGERDLKTPIDFSHDGVRPGHPKGNGVGDSDEDEDDSDVPRSGAKSTALANKRRVSGTKSRPARNSTLVGLQEEKPDIDELEHDTALSQRSPRPHLQVNASDDEHEHALQERRRAESGASVRGHRDQSTQDGRNGEAWSSPRSSNRQLPGYANTHDLLMAAGGSSVLGLPFSLGHLASQLTPQQLSTLAPHLSALASQQQQLSGLTAQQLSSLSPQHQELLALHAVKQQQQQLHLQQREQLASLQNSLRGAPNRLATLNLNLSGLGNLSTLSGMGGLGSLASLGSLGDRELASLGQGGSLGGLPIRKMGLGSGNFPSGLTSVSSSGTSGGGGGGAHSQANPSTSFSHPSSANNSNFNSHGNGPNEQSGPLPNADDGSWLDFLSLPSGRIDPAALSGLGPLSSLTIGGLLDRERDRESAVRNGGASQPDGSSTLFGLPFGASGSSGSNAAFGSGVASGGGYGLGVGLGQDGLERRGTPTERSASRAESMDVDKESGRRERSQEGRGRSTEREERERDDESHLRKRPRWE